MLIGKNIENNTNSTPNNQNRGATYPSSSAGQSKSLLISRSGVRIPPGVRDAVIVQMVEHQSSKLGVAGSSPASRSVVPKKYKKQHRGK